MIGKQYKVCENQPAKQPKSDNSDDVKEDNKTEVKVDEQEPKQPNSKQCSQQNSQLDDGHNNQISKNDEELKLSSHPNPETQNRIKPHPQKSPPTSKTDPIAFKQPLNKQNASKTSYDASESSDSEAMDTNLLLAQLSKQQ